jgi:RNA polymerase sigma factor (sigma-70 family)
MPAATAVEAPVDLDRFLAEEYRYVVAAVALVTGDRSTAEDAVQDAIVTLLAKPPDEPLRSAAAWITVVASNRGRSVVRRKAVERRKMETIGARPTRDAVEPDIRDDVTRAVANLPLQQRQVCVLHYYLDASVAEIAEALSVSVGTVKTQLFRARQTLAVSLGEPEPREDDDV